MIENINKRWQCKNCDKIILESNLLHTPNPFNEIDIIIGCPHCKNVNEFDEICDEPKCDKHATCGFPIKKGYRRTCGEHYHQYCD